MNHELRLSNRHETSTEPTCRVDASVARKIRADGPYKVVYLVNHYPKVSHSFIRREIQALEAQGMTVMRTSIRGWNERLPDARDEEERQRTRYVLKNGLGGLLIATLCASLSRPRRFVHAFWLATRMGWRSGRSIAYHWAYLAEACVLGRWMQQEGISHVHAHFGTNSTDVAMLATALGMARSYSFTAHGPEEFDGPRSLALSEKVERAQFVVAISSFGRSQLMRWIGPEHWQKVKVVHCGLDELFRRTTAQPPPAAPRLVCVGRLCEQKGQLLLIDAMALLVRRGVDCELVLAGDGEMRAQIEDRIVRHDLCGRIRITGWISGDQVRDELLAARALVLPSFAEGLPVVLMEAMALQRPVVSTLVAGIPELVVPEECGWLVPAGDVEALADAMQQCLETPVDRLAQMGLTARQRVLQRHDADQEARKLYGLLAHATDKARKVV
ncbi:MAG: colanic acid biosynthesis glycosyltransferase WcaL [Caldimonas sp.]|nr:MAG: colanic acid biosynthesis glycosyltransferase WcaL [Caldimonas sp.]